MARLLIVDDHPLFRQAFRFILSQQGDLAIAGEAGDGVEAVEMAWTIRPDLVLMDHSMPRIGGGR